MIQKINRFVVNLIVKGKESVMATKASRTKATSTKVAKVKVPVHNMATTYLNCCGIKEISRLGEYMTPEAAMEGFCAAFQPTHKVIKPGDTNYSTPSTVFNCAFMLFSQAGISKGSKGYGDKFAAFILENGLGEIIEGPSKVNPNSKRLVKPFIWTIDQKAVTKWAKTNCDWLAPTGDVVAKSTAADGQVVQPLNVANV